MDYLNVIVAAAASWLFGALWYMIFAKPWQRVSGAKMGSDRPDGGRSPMPFILSAIAMLIVAGLLRFVFTQAGVFNPFMGAVYGGAVGLFAITPWTMINNAYAGRPALLTVIDGGYSTIGCAIMGIALVMI